MKKILIGLLFIFFDFNLSFNQVSIDIIPDIIGFILIIQGIHSLTTYSDYFIKSKTIAYILTVWAAVELFIKLVDSSLLAVTTLFDFAAGLIYTILLIYLLYLFVQGIIEIEHSLNIDLESKKLHTYWTYYTICSCITCITIFLIPIAIIFSIVSFVSIIIFLIAFNRTSNIFHSGDHLNNY